MERLQKKLLMPLVNIMKNKRVKIICNSTLPSRNTEYFIELTNLFNERSVDCTLYGPDEWHIDQCNGKHISEFSLTKGDTIIANGIKINSRYEFLSVSGMFFSNSQKTSHKIKKALSNFVKKLVGKKTIQSCWFILDSLTVPLDNYSCVLYDKIHVQKSVGKELVGQYFCCPQLTGVPTLVKKDTNQHDISIIQDIVPDNNIETLIKYSIANYPENNIILYGAIVDPVYFYSNIVPLLEANTRLKYAGYTPIQNIYEKHESIIINDLDDNPKQLKVNENLVNDIKNQREIIMKTWSENFRN